MSSPLSCTRCSKPQALLSLGGLCPECAATDATAGPTSVVPTPAGLGAFAPTTSHPAPAHPTITLPPEAGTVPVADDPPVPLPPAPPGYELLRHLGGGGMGDVYLAREQPSERLVAVKFLRHPDHAGVQRFVTELRALAELDHPNIVRMFAADFLRATPFFAMEYVEGGSLSHALKARPLPVAEAVRLIRAVAGAVGVAHAAGVVHRDLKPSNILLAPDGTPKVADFGLAKRLDRTDGPTLTGGLGTPGYMPPEQVSSKNGEVGFWSDVYGLGATLYHLLTGRPPFVGETPEEIVPQVLADAPVRPRALKPEIPLALEGIVVKCLAKEPTERYQTVAGFLADLDRFAAGQKPAAPPLTRGRRAKQWVTRNRRRIVASVLAVILPAGAFVLGAAYWPKPKPKDPLELIHKELRNGRPVVLIGPVGAPQYSRWPLGTPTIIESPFAEGAFSFEAPHPTQLELLRDSPRDRYRVTADLRLLYQKTIVFGGKKEDVLPGGDGVRIGLYFGDTTPKAVEDRPAHLCLVVCYNDHLTEAARKAKITQAEVQVNTNAVLVEPNGLPRARMAGFTRRIKFDPVADLPGEWRRVRVDITPEGAKVFWAKSPDAPWQPLVDLSADEITNRLTVATTKPENQLLRGQTITWNPQAAVGIWCQRGAMSVRNVSVESLP